MIDSVVIDIASCPICFDYDLPNTQDASREIVLLHPQEGVSFASGQQLTERLHWVCHECALEIIRREHPCPMCRQELLPISCNSMLNERGEITLVRRQIPYFNNANHVGHEKNFQLFMVSLGTLLMLSMATDVFLERPSSCSDTLDFSVLCTFLLNVKLYILTICEVAIDPIDVMDFWLVHLGVFSLDAYIFFSCL